MSRPFCAIVPLLLLLAPEARAQVGVPVVDDVLAGQELGSINAERFRPAVSREGLLDVESADVGEHLDFDVTLWGGYALNPLLVKIRDGETGAVRRAPLVGHRVGANLLGSISLFEWVQLGFDLPVVLFQTGQYEIDGLREDNNVFFAGVGDLRVMPKFRLLRDKAGQFVDVAVLAAFSVPTALPRQSYIGDGFFTLQPELAISKSFDFGLRLALNTGLMLRLPSSLGQISQGEMFTYRMGAGYQLHPFGVPVGFDATFNGEVQLWPRPLGFYQNPHEFLVGAHWDIWKGIRVQGAIGAGTPFLENFAINSGPSTPDVRVQFSIGWSPRCDDPDDDGVCGQADKCPESAEDADGFDDHDGCPDRDNDGDGVDDPQDTCPDEAEDGDGFEDADGCPDPDNDGDTVLDAEDKCPDEAGAAEQEGCPVRDADGDGVLDDADRCPAVPGDPALKGCPDTDGDGFVDRDDKCPEEAGIAAREGCPVRDADKDGVEDADDKCPQAAGPVEREGCPINDRDGDGVNDATDACPDDAGPAARTGCPIPDEDGDGVEDADDKCPKVAGPAMLKGCPDTDGDGIADSEDTCPADAGPAVFQGCPDDDKDGIPLPADQCPNEPETINGNEDTDGCPDVGKTLVVITKEKIEILETVYFKTGRATIQSRSFGLLDQVASVLRANQEIGKVRVEGHTDAQGAAGSNKRLSERRAAAVRSYLVDAGIDPRRLEAVGYGEERPVADNATAEGRAANRRVEFVIVQGEDAE